MGRIGYFIVISLLFAVATARANTWGVRTVALEASGEPLAVQIMVASVIKRRMADCECSALTVVTARAQFAAYPQRRQLTAVEWETAREAWERSEVGEYTHFAGYWIDNYWTRASVRWIRLGKLKFYKLK